MNYRGFFSFSILLFLVWLAKAQIFIPMAFWQAHPVLIEISDANTYNFGTISTNISVDKTFIVSNIGNIPATNVAGDNFTSARFNWKGGTFPGTGGSCTSTIAAGASCTVVITALSATAGAQSDTVSIAHYDGYATVSAKRPITATFTASPTRLKFIVTADFIRVNQCVAVTIQSQDDVGQPMNVAANTTVTLVLNNTTNTSFFTTNTCATTTTSRTITAGTNSVTFYIRSTTANQSGIMVGTAAGLTTAEQTFLVTNTPTRLYLVAAPQIKTNVCRALIIRTVDNNYFPANATALVTVNLATTGANVYYSDSGCTSNITSTTIASGTFNRIIYTQNATVQTNTLTASDNAAVLISSTASVAFTASLTWWNTSWANRIRIEINNADQATVHTNIPILVELDTSNFDYSAALANGADLRFVASDNTTVLAHEFDYWNPGGTSLVWVEVGSIAASTPNNHIFMYYGNLSASDGQSPSNVWSSYWSVWHLNEDPSDAAPQYNDPIGNRNGTGLNSPTKVTGALGGYAVGLLTGSDAVDVNSDLSAALGASSTFSAWMKTSQTGNNTMWQAPGLTGVEQAGGGNDIFFGWIDGSGFIGVTAGNGLDAKSDFVVNNNAWRHVTITRNSGTGQVIFYINGVNNNQANSETGVKTTYFDLLGEIGDTGGSPVNYNGLLDEVRIYNSVQTPARVLADFKYMMNTHIIYNAAEVQ